MSGEPKTLTLTLEEAMFHIADEGRYRLACGRSAQNTLDWLVLDKSGAVLSASRDWEVAATRALGVPVVARDEAREPLRALRELIRDTKELLHDLDLEGVESEWRDPLDSSLDYAQRVLKRYTRRLAGGEDGK